MVKFILRVKHIQYVRYLRLDFSDTTSSRQNMKTVSGHEKAPSRRLSLHYDPIPKHKLQDFVAGLSWVLDGERSICFLGLLGYVDDIRQSAVLPRNWKNSPQLLLHKTVDIELLGSG
jgi:hypothetical protein